MSARVLVLCLLWAGIGCNKTEAYVAELQQIEAQVERTTGDSTPWRAARVGDRFALGSAVRTGPASRARLRVGRDGVLHVDPNAVVRFTSRPGRSRSDVHVEAGSIVLEAGDETLELGDVVLEPHGRAQVSYAPEGTRINVTLGQLLLEGGDAPTVVAAGTTVVVPGDGTSPAKVEIPVDAASAPEPVAGAVTVKVTHAAARRATADGSAPLPVGEHQLAPGTAITVRAGSTLEVSRGDARAQVTGPAELRVGGNDAALVTLAGGTVALHAGSADAEVEVPGGRIAARGPGSGIQARITGPRTEIEVRVGEGTIRSPTAEETLATGDAATLSRDGTIAFKTRAPARVMLSVAAGESPVIHAPRVPVAVRVRFGAVCPAAAVLEVAKDRAFKRVVARTGARSDGANVQLAPGSFSYRVRCDGGPGANGTIKVKRDSGHARLPKAAAHTLVEADGREYTILYQNLLPELTLSWRTAPPAASYTFVVTPKRGPAKRLPSTTSQLSLRSGELREGRYALWVESVGSRRRSETTQIVIDFNNAAASASIESVDVKDGKVWVRGVVIEDSTVTASGAPVELDRHRRFSTELAPLADEDGIGLRIAHPKLGVHYYVIPAAAS